MRRRQKGNKRQRGRRERKHQLLVRTLLLNTLQSQARHPGCPDSQDWKIKQLPSSVLGSASHQLIFSSEQQTCTEQQIFVWHSFQCSLSCATDKVALFLLLFPSRQPHEPPQGHQSPPASGLHGGNYLCSLRADNPSIPSLLSSPPRPLSLLFPSFIVSFVWNI